MTASKDLLLTLHRKKTTVAASVYPLPCRQEERKYHQKQKYKRER